MILETNLHTHFGGGISTFTFLTSWEWEWLCTHEDAQIPKCQISANSVTWSSCPFACTENAVHITDEWIALWVTRFKQVQAGNLYILENIWQIFHSNRRLHLGLWLLNYLIAYIWIKPKWYIYKDHFSSLKYDFYMWNLDRHSVVRQYHDGLGVCLCMGDLDKKQGSGPWYGELLWL